jgi:spore germination protein YaaH
MIAASLGVGFFLSPIEANAYNLHTWVVDWDKSSYQEYSQRKYNSVSNFAVSFNEDLSMNIPEQFKGKNVYLSFVNDLSNSPKDQDLLAKLLHDDVTINNLIDDMINASKDYKGIEVDFEGFWKNPALTKQYMIFTYRLYHQCLKHNLKLRIVLEPSFTTQDYIKGPEYVVMCYNLYGKHSGPGAKATKKLIEPIVEKMKMIPSQRGVAIATGGCIWEVNNTRYLNEEDCYKIIPKDKYMRDGASYDLTYEGKDTIIYVADVETLNHQIELLHKLDMNNIYLWRLGGNVNLKKLNTK